MKSREKSVINDQMLIYYTINNTLLLYTLCTICMYVCIHVALLVSKVLLLLVYLILLVCAYQDHREDDLLTATKPQSVCTEVCHVCSCACVCMCAYGQSDMWWNAINKSEDSTTN